MVLILFTTLVSLLCNIITALWVISLPGRFSRPFNFVGDYLKWALITLAVFGVFSNSIIQLLTGLAFYLAVRLAIFDIAINTLRRLPEQYKTPGIHEGISDTLSPLRAPHFKATRIVSLIIGAGLLILPTFGALPPFPQGPYLAIYLPFNLLMISLIHGQAATLNTAEKHLKDL